MRKVEVTKIVVSNGVKILPPLTDKHIDEVCKPGTEDCCRYLTCGSQGFECAKKTSLQHVIDQRVKDGEFNAKGDNCEGRS